MTINKAIVIVLAVIALGLFTVAGSVIYSTQPVPQKTQIPQKTQFENEALLGCSESEKPDGSYLANSLIEQYETGDAVRDEFYRGQILQYPSEAGGTQRKIACLQLLDLHTKRVR